jgi:hypothetical protein
VLQPVQGLQHQRVQEHPSKQDHPRAPHLALSWWASLFHDVPAPVHPPAAELVHRNAPEPVSPSVPAALGVHHDPALRPAAAATPWSWWASPSAGTAVPPEAAVVRPHRHDPVPAARNALVCQAVCANPWHRAS